MQADVLSISLHTLSHSALLPSSPRPYVGGVYAKFGLDGRKKHIGSLERRAVGELEPVPIRSRPRRLWGGNA